ncbi:MgtC/SapB transporter [Synechocystis sp. LKSZ1]
MRTFMLVSMGSALFVMIPLQAEGDSAFAATNALSRTIQGVSSGVGFIGAGLILQQSDHRNQTKVRGLTTAASIWIAAALGATIGCGLWQTGLLGGFLTLLVLSGVKRLRRWILIALGKRRQAQLLELEELSEPEQNEYFFNQELL